MAMTPKELQEKIRSDLSCIHYDKRPLAAGYSGEHQRLIMAVMPAMVFPADWKITLWPPFAGAAVRFQVNRKISVYCDVSGQLGAMPEPYWEFYPNAEDNCSRYLLNDWEEMFKEIAQCL